MLIFVNQISERLLYTMNFVFKDRGVKFEITNDTSFFQEAQGVKLNYSSNNFEGIPQIVPCKLLFDQPVIRYEIQKVVFFEEECFSFDNCTDPFASIFFVLSRMEEYQASKKDKLGRFEGKNSLLYKFGWHEKVVCDRWSLDILNFLKSNYSNFEFIDQLPFVAMPTFDIDNTYAYKNKGFVRTTLAILKDFFLGRTRRLIERQKVQAGLMKDPYDTFHIIEETADKFPNTRVFWLLGDFAKLDKNIHHSNKRQRNLIKRLNQKIEIGIHPSVKSNSYEFFLHNEIERLEAILCKRVYTSRQHFLMLQFPETYRILKGQEIREDFTMGYADIVGFRAGTARPFFWFDLHKNECTKLLIHPFSYMDGTLNEYMQLTVEEAKEKVHSLVQEVKTYGGEFSFIWHNETIGNYGTWKRWDEVFKFTLEEIL